MKKEYDFSRGRRGFGLSFAKNLLVIGAREKSSAGPTFNVQGSMLANSPFYYQPPDGAAEKLRVMRCWVSIGS